MISFSEVEVKIHLKILIIMITTALVSCISTPPTYSQIIKTYPDNTKLCITDIHVVREINDSQIELSGTAEIRGGSEIIQCYGAKVTLDISTKWGEIIYPAGTMLTVDKNLDWIEVSSWK
jgi:hypothetical protein